jgi:hypothetical protein
VSTRHDCPVILPADCVAGERANAFRILPENGSEVVLDFCTYSADDNVATVVCRVRMNRVFLPDVRSRLLESLRELPA